MNITHQMTRKWAESKSDAELAAIVREALGPAQFTTATQASFAEVLVRMIATDREWDVAIESVIATLALDALSEKSSTQITSAEHKQGASKL